jgi:hypothetical protein
MNSIRYCSITGLVAVLAITLAGAARAQEKPKSAGRSLSEDAGLVRREAFGKPWEAIKKNEEIPSGYLVLGLPKSALASKNGAVKLVYWTDWSQTAPHPIIDTAVTLRDTSGFDMDLFVDRGWVGLINQKKEGAAKVRVQTHGGGSWELTLNEPGSVITLMVYGRWPRGVPFKPEPGPKDIPTFSAVFLALEGTTTLKHEGDSHLLKEPPGPALVVWDSVTGHDSAPQFLEDPPRWASPKAITEDVEERLAMQDRFRKRVMEKGVDEALGEFLSSDKPMERRLGVVGIAALDDLIRLGDALRQTKYPDVWDNAVLALRHWIARAPGNDQLLYQGMLARRKWKPAEAETALQLLHSFSEEEVQSPELYETLIDFLDHDNLAIRGLAHWHLYRLVPAGEKIEHHPTDSKEKRQAAKKEWQKLIPRGKVPAKAPPADPEKSPKKSNP